MQQGRDQGPQCLVQRSGGQEGPACHSRAPRPHPVGLARGSVLGWRESVQQEAACPSLSPRFQSSQAT